MARENPPRLPRAHRTDRSDVRSLHLHAIGQESSQTCALCACVSLGRTARIPRPWHQPKVSRVGPSAYSLSPDFAQADGAPVVSAVPRGPWAGTVAPRRR